MEKNHFNIDENTNIPNWHSIKNHQNVLINACEHGQLNLIEEHLTNNDINDVLSTGWTLLLYAASFCNVEVVSYLLEHGADANQNKDGFTPLMALCNSTNGSTARCSMCLSILIEASNSVDTVDNYRQSALMYACKSRNVENVKELLKHVRCINAQDNEGYTALMYAVLYNKIEVVKLLLNYKANPLIKNNYFDTAKDIAEVKEYEEISTLLKEDDHITITYTTSRVNKWKNLFPKLNPTKDQVVNINVVNILSTIELYLYINNFQGIDFETFLQLTEEDLINLKMDISTRRNRLLKFLNYFHYLPWHHDALKEMIRHCQGCTNLIEIMASMTQQILIMTSTFHFIQININNDSFHDIFIDDRQILECREKIKNIEETVATLKKRLLQVKTIADEINVKNALKIPPSYIGPKVIKKGYFKSIILSMLLVYGIYLTKVQICK